LYAKLLPSHLNEKATRVFASLSFEQCADDAVVKSHLIASFRASSSHYLAKFRSIKRSGAETQTMFVARLSEAYGFFLQAGEVETFDQIREATILEQFMNTLEGAAKQHVQICSPKNALEAAKVADIYFENRPKSQKNFSASHIKKLTLRVTRKTSKAQLEGNRKTRRCLLLKSRCLGASDSSCAGQRAKRLFYLSGNDS